MGDGRERYSRTDEKEQTSDTFTATSPDRESAAPPVDVATGMARREFLKRTTIVGGGLAVWQGLLREEPAAAVEQSPTVPGIVGPTVAVRLRVNGSDYQLRLEPRMTLLDALRDGLGLTGTKKTCDRGACGACTVHVEGRRILSCMTLAAMQDGKRIPTIEALARTVPLHPVQAAFKSWLSVSRPALPPTSCRRE